VAKAVLEKATEPKAMAMAMVDVGALSAAEWAPKSPKKSTAFPSASVMIDEKNNDKVGSQV